MGRGARQDTHASAATLSAEEVRGALRSRETRARKPTWGTDRAADHDPQPQPPDPAGRLVAHRREHTYGWQWRIGWVGSTHSMALDEQTGRVRWMRHASSGKPLALTDDELERRSHKEWKDLPDDLREKIRAGAAQASEIDSIAMGAPLSV